MNPTGSVPEFTSVPQGAEPRSTDPEMDGHRHGAVRPSPRAAPSDLARACPERRTHEKCESAGARCKAERHPACPRCGAPFLSLVDLAGIAVEADRAYREMRLAVPSKLSAGVRVLAAALPCHAGTCMQAVSQPLFPTRNGASAATGKEPERP